MQSNDRDVFGETIDGGGVLVPQPGNGYGSPLVGGDGDGVLAVGSPGSHPPASLHHYLTLLLRHKWLAMAVSFLIAGTAIPLIWVLVIPNYRAVAVVRVSPIVDKILHEYEGNGLLPLYSSFLNTQVSVIRSPKVLQRVLDLPEVQATEWYKNKRVGLFGAHLPALHRLKRSLSVVPRRNTELIDVAMSATRATDAKLIADAVVEQYLDVVALAGRESETGRMKTLLDRSAKLRADIDQLIRQKALVSKRIGTQAPDDLRSYETTQLSILSDELDKLVRERKHNAWRLARLSSDPDAAPDDDVDLDTSSDASVRYVDDLEWRRLRQTRDDAVHRLEGMREHYGAEHPSIKRAIADVEYAEKLLANREMELDDPGATPIRALTTADGTIVNAHYDSAWLENAIAESLDKEKQLQAAIDTQTERVNLLSERAVDLASLDEKISETRSEASLVRARLNVLRVERLAAGRVNMASSAMLPAEPSSDRRILLTIMALLGAMGSGMGAAFLRAFLDPSVRQIDDVPAVAQMPFLGYLPKMEIDADHWDNASDEVQESVRMIRTSLLDRLPSTSCMSLLITSSGAKAGKTSVTMLLAKSLADIGRKVLLVDADLRRASLTHRLEAESVDGLTEVLSGAISPKKAIRSSKIDGVDVVPSGHCSPETDTELIAGNALGAAVDEWKKLYDVVLLDSPPILPVADARILAGKVDGAILTLRASHCRKMDVFGAVSLLASSGCKPLGTVLVGADHALGYGGYDRYTYSAHVVG